MYLSNIVLALLVALSVALVVWSVPSIVSGGIVGNLRRKKLAEIDEYHRTLFVREVTPAQLYRRFELFFLLATLIIFLFSRSILVTLIFMLPLWLIPKAIYLYSHKKRIDKFELNLPTGLDQLNGAIRAGMTLTQALDEVSAYAPAPVSEEFGQIAADQKLGVDLTTALKSARERIGSRTFNLVVSAFLVNIRQGGNLTETVDTLSGSLKEIWRLEQKLNTASAEGRKGAAIMCAMPVVILVIFAIGQPDLIKLLVSGLVGYMSLAAAVICYALGLLWLNKILNFDV